MIMKEIEIEHELEDAVKDKNRVFVLFYASWCPFSQRFLPIYEKHAQKTPQSCMRIKIERQSETLKNTQWMWCLQCWSLKKELSRNGLMGNKALD